MVRNKGYIAQDILYILAY